MSAYEHYETHGAALALDPNRFFSTEWYLQHNPDVAAAGINPLVHYLKHGSSEGREPGPLFNAAWYLEQYPDVAAECIGALQHYIQFGADEGRDPNGWFDTRWYLDQNPDVQAAGVNAYLHYLEHGVYERRNPSPLFLTEWYDRKNPDVASTRINPFVHFLTYGIATGRAPSPYFSADNLADYHIIKRANIFDREFYCARFPDVAQHGYDPLVHFVQSGAAERRDPSPDFGIRRYVAKYPVAGLPGVNPLVHHILKGRLAVDPAPRFSRNQTLWSPPADQAWRASFERRLSERLSARAKNIGGRIFDDAAPTFSIITTVYDTASKFLFELADSIEAQLFDDFEWVILDNGSNDLETRSAICAIADRDPRFRLFRVEHNLHIIGGNRYVFERANGHYIVPIDSDDLLYPDSLALIADVLRRNTAKLPVLIYSDEQKVDEQGEPLELIWRLNYSMSQAMQTAPAAHLLVFERAAGEKVDVYSDDYARGSHDWDTLLRLTENGADVVHVPEVLYGWRVHAQSTASHTTAKDYIVDSQREVVLASLQRRGLSNRFSIEAMFAEVPGWYRTKRLNRELPTIDIDFILPFDAIELGATAHNVRRLSKTAGWRRVVYPATLEKKIIRLRTAAKIDKAVDEWIAISTYSEFVDAINQVRPESFAKAIITSSAAIKSADAVIEAVSVFELDPRAGIIGGPLVHKDGGLQNIGLMAGLDGFVGTPFFGWPIESCPPHLTNVRRPVVAFPALALCIRADLLRKGAQLSGIDYDDAEAGLELCLAGAQLGYNTILDSRLHAEVAHDLRQFTGAGTSWRSRMLAEHKELISSRGFSTHLTAIGIRFGSLADQSETSSSIIRTLSPAIPLNLIIDPDLGKRPAINVLLPAVRKESLSGGPNTALNIAYRLAAIGHSVRIISTDLPPGNDLDVVWELMTNLSGTAERLPHVEIVDGSDRSRPLKIGNNDIFFATAWWTAVMAQAASPLVGKKPFVYLIQDFEPLFYAASSHYALALETYSFSYIPIVNTHLLHDFLVKNGIGQFAQPSYVANSLVFEPALDRSLFYPPRVSSPPRIEVGQKSKIRSNPKAPKKRRLLFYARPSIGVRNLFEIGLAALTEALDQHIIDPGTWEIIGMGEDFLPRPLGHGATLECAPWLGLAGYAEQMRESDILLSLMLSPHPSYPPLEMASSGGLVVTNSYANKTSEQLADISANIIAAEPKVGAIVAALRTAVGRIDDVEAREIASKLELPASWDEAFAQIIPNISNCIVEKGVIKDLNIGKPTDEPVQLRLPTPEPGSAYAAFLAEVAERRARFNVGLAETGLFTFVTTVWNTAPAYLDVLAKSLERQIGGTNFTWFILDNGSTRADTRAMLERIARRSYVQLQRVEENLGIIGGMRYCLERADGRYILPLDSDDYLFPDCIRTLAWYVQKHDYPALLYTDEDKLIGERLSMPFQKPDFDPVLFLVQCYIAHLCVIDRKLALDLGAYSDQRAEGSHDWDTFTRFYNAGHVPVHIPHILYSWRLHTQSTAGGNMETKPVVFDSQCAVLERMRAGISVGNNFSLEASPLFGQTPDWWWKRRRINGRAITTIFVHSGSSRSKIVDPRIADGIEHCVVEVAISDGLGQLQKLVTEAAAQSRLVHLLFSDTYPDDDEWAWEAIGQLELHSDAVAVGGRIYDKATIIDAGQFFGFGSGCDSPDRGRAVTDAGYAAQLFKQRSVNAVSVQHAVFNGDFLKEAINHAILFNAQIAHLSAWIGSYAAKTRRRIIYSPFISAQSSLDLTNQVSARDKGIFLAANAELMPERRLRSPNFGIRPEEAYEPRLTAQYSNPDGVELPHYGDWSTLGRSSKISDERKKTPVFSILTTLYSRTDAVFFQTTAASVIGQSFADFEWVILAHGPVTPEVNHILETLATDHRVHVHRLSENLGIIGGMRYVLEAARGHYIVPLDGDDLLTPDALSVFSTVLDAAETLPAVLYSDEDIIIGETVQLPYCRPSWDPVLDLENSWIWHLVAMSRTMALDLNLYSDAGAEYCHDWDSMERFSAAEAEIVHVPQVLCHWRHHERSTSNSDATNTVSSASVRHVLTRKIARLGMADKAVAAPYPIWRGAEEWWIERLPIDLPPLIAVAHSGVTSPAGFALVTLADIYDRVALAECVAKLDPDAIVAVLAHEVTFSDIAALEVVKLFDFIKELAIVCGPITANGKIVSAGFSIDSAGKIYAPFDGQDENYAGPYALGLKPHCIAAPPTGAFFVRVSFLTQSLAAAPRSVSHTELALWMGAYAAKHGKRVGYSPLLRSQAEVLPSSERDPLSTQLAWQAFCAPTDIATMGTQSIGGYVPVRWRS
ncbi:glycosyltransferase involved in cell wall biosynthesis [Sphingobium subterraneum]|uniref:Glycosyltransferase involved in cell wall biosynthesis n=2 Tax=Sphingobium subterraneum TaxID=627688 RepID=A0A841IZA4_9SPHN|nr:glycosyltransferase involved in cell wall biosynthesis [Sphingobium subterraneum]